MTEMNSYLHSIWQRGQKHNHNCRKHIKNIKNTKKPCQSKMKYIKVEHKYILRQNYRGNYSLKEDRTEPNRIEEWEKAYYESRLVRVNERRMLMADVCVCRCLYWCKGPRLAL